jgi:hypothetical protein
MARIKTYIIDAQVNENDIVIGSDGDNGSATRNYRMKAIKDYVMLGFPAASSNLSALINDVGFLTAETLPASSLSLQDVITVNRRGDEVEFIYSLTDGVRLRGGLQYGIDSQIDTLNTTKYYVYGDFETADGIIKRDIVRLNADNSLDTTFNIGTGTNAGSYPYNGSKFSISTEGKIYISGSFTSFNGVPANRIISLNNDGTVNTAFIYGSGFNNFTLENCFNKAGTHIYVTGLFSTYNGASALKLAKIAINGTLDTSFVVGSGFNNTTIDVLVNNDESIFVSGYFSTYKGVSANKITKLLPNGDRDVTFQSGSGFNTGNNQPNFIFRNSDGILIIYGYFTTYNGTARNRIIALNDDGTVNNNYDFGTGFSTTVYKIIEKSTGGYYIYSQGGLYKGKAIQQVIELNNAFEFVRSLFNISNIVGGSTAIKGFVFSNDEQGQYFTPMELTATYGRVANKLTFSKTTGKAEYLIGDLVNIAKDEIMPRRLIEELIVPQVNSDWGAVSGVAEILNKPTIPTVPTNVSDFVNDAGYLTTAGGIASVTGTAVNNTDPLNPVVNSIPQVNSDWNATSGVSQILNKPVISAGAIGSLQQVTNVGAITTNDVTVNNLKITQLSNNLITPVFQPLYTDIYDGASQTYYRLPIDSSGDMYWNRPTSNVLKIIGINGSTTSVDVGTSNIVALVLNPINDDLYIASKNGEIYLRTKAGILTLFATCPSVSLRDIVRDSTGNFFVIESATIPRIFKITNAGVVTTFTSTVLNFNAIWLGIDLNNNLYTIGVGANIKKITPAGVFSDILIPNNPNFNTLCPVCDTLGDGSMYFGNSYASGEIYKITPAGIGSVFFLYPTPLGTTNLSIYNRKLYVSSTVYYSALMVINLDTVQKIADLSLEGYSGGEALRVNPVDGNLYFTSSNRYLMRINRSYSKLLTVNAVGDVYKENSLTSDVYGTVFTPNATIGEINFDDTGKSLITKEYLQANLLNKFRQQKIVTGSTYAILPSDLYATLFFNRSSAITVTINVLPVFFECDFYNFGTGTVTFVSNVGLLVSPSGLNLLYNKQGSLKRMTDTAAYILSGGLS